MRSARQLLYLMLGFFLGGYLVVVVHSCTKEETEPGSKTQVRFGSELHFNREELPMIDAYEFMKMNGAWFWEDHSTGHDTDSVKPPSPRQIREVEDATDSDSDS